MAETTVSALAYRPRNSGSLIIGFPNVASRVVNTHWLPKMPIREGNHPGRCQKPRDKGMLNASPRAVRGLLIRFFVHWVAHRKPSSSRSLPIASHSIIPDSAKLSHDRQRLAGALDGGVDVGVGVGGGDEAGLELRWGDVDAALQQRVEVAAVGSGDRKTVKVSQSSEKSFLKVSLASALE